MATNGNDALAAGVLVATENTPWVDQQRYFIWLSDRVTIGRAANCVVRISHPTVSRLHAEVTWVNGALTLIHRSPINPSFVNGVPVSEPRMLHAGDIIEIANIVEFRLEILGGQELPTEAGLRVLRRLYAIVHADVSGYSRLIEFDANGTARQLDSYLEMVRRRVENEDGHIVQIAGDGVLMLFSSAVSAVTATVAWQRSLRSLNSDLPLMRRLEFRAGINSGDILITPAGGRHGDPINIAARIQALAPPGGILATSAVRDQIRGHNDYTFEPFNIGPIKDLSRETQIFSVNF